ncbi:MAG: glycosyltransferase, partial [Crocinitomicaceae bacterium]
MSESSKSIVIIPTYNEVENVDAISRSIISLENSFDILFIDDNSPDGTAEAIIKLMSEFSGRIFLEQRTGKLGLGTAYIHGFKWAINNNYNYVIEMDCDFSHDPNDLPRLLKSCQDGADVSIGSRYCKG